MLVADDSAFARACLRNLIDASGGFDVVGEAASAAEAVDLYTLLRPDVVTMDMNMPGLSGLDAILALREIEPGCRIVLITAVREDQIVNGLAEMGVPVLHKPVQGSELSVLLASGAPRERRGGPRSS